MQDFQSAPAGVAGRIFFAGTSSGDVEDFLRLRGYPMVGGGAPAAVQQLPVKCPRCDSANTKFCYYNNYNLSQPRHFCKNCRRYWTKGGVLRNVPVGGGCRKTKRSSSSKSSSKPSASGDKDGQQRRTSSSASRLSSKSSSNTAATAGDASALTPPMSGDPPILDQLVNTVVDAPSCSASETLQEALSARSLANVMVASAAPSASPVPFLGFSFNDPSPVRLPTGQHKTIDLEIGEQEKGQQQPQGFIVDHVISGDLRTVAGVGGGTGGLRALDWPSTVDPALFASAVDPGAYWNPNHLEYTDDSIYLS